MTRPSNGSAPNTRSSQQVAETFVPQPLIWIESDERPVLVIEDLSDAHWPADHFPVLWKPGQFDILFATLRRVAAVTAPALLPSADTGFEPTWPALARDAERFLALRLCPERWFIPYPSHNQLAPVHLAQEWQLPHVHLIGSGRGDDPVGPSGRLGLRSRLPMQARSRLQFRRQWAQNTVGTSSARYGIRWQRTKLGRPSRGPSREHRRIAGHLRRVFRGELRHAKSCHLQSYTETPSWKGRPDIASRGRQAQQSRNQVIRRPGRPVGLQGARLHLRMHRETPRRRGARMQEDIGPRLRKYPVSGLTRSTRSRKYSTRTPAYTA